MILEEKEIMNKDKKIIVEIPADIKRRLELRAEINGRAMMREAAKIIKDAVSKPQEEE